MITIKKLITLATCVGILGLATHTHTMHLNLKVAATPIDEAGEPSEVDKKLTMAIMSSNAENMQELLTAKADPNHVSVYNGGLTPLQLVIAMANCPRSSLSEYDQAMSAKSMIELLILHGAHIDDNGCIGQTPAALAQHIQHFATYVALLKAETATIEKNNYTATLEPVA